MTTRREFLIGGLSAGAAVPVIEGLSGPQWLHGMGNNAAQKTLVVIQVNGGWDYFNQIVPTYSSEYYNARPTSGGIGIAKKDALPIASNVKESWAPALQGFKDLYDRGDLAVVNNVGYPVPNLSHFESEAKWYTADAAATRAGGGTGWLASYLHAGYKGKFAPAAIDTGTAPSMAFQGARVPALGSTRTLDYQFDSASPGDNRVARAILEASAILSHRARGGDLTGEMAAVLENSFPLFEQMRKVSNNHIPKVRYPYNIALTPLFYKIAAYITKDFGSHLYYISTGAGLNGYDHHSALATTGAGHTGKFADQIKALTGNIKAFLDDMKAWGKSKDVAVLVFSEFGRRFGMNGSRGTDHGHGGCAYVAGEPVKGGWFGNYPDLTKATTPYRDWYPPYDQTSTDFRQLYATMLEKWLGVPHDKVLRSRYKMLGCF